MERCVPEESHDKADDRAKFGDDDIVPARFVSRDGNGAGVCDARLGPEAFHENTVWFVQQLEVCLYLDGFVCGCTMEKAMHPVLDFDDQQPIIGQGIYFAAHKPRNAIDISHLEFIEGCICVTGHSHDRPYVVQRLWLGAGPVGSEQILLECRVHQGFVMVCQQHASELLVHALVGRRDIRRRICHDERLVDQGLHLGVGGGQILDGIFIRFQSVAFQGILER